MSHDVSADPQTLPLLHLVKRSTETREFTESGFVGAGARIVPRWVTRWVIRLR